MPALSEELAQSLRVWRGRLAPADAALQVGGHRRVSGLRREEVAQLAGVSDDYLARLEQGRASSPSASVLAALARTLRLSVDERSHLYTLAGHVSPGPGVIDRHVTPSLHRLLDRLADVPVLVVDAGAGIVAANGLGAALVGDIPGATRRERNIAWRQFVGDSTRIVRTPEEQARAEEATVADLRQALARHPEDRELNGLIEELQRVSPHFAELWEMRPASSAPARRKTFRHPRDRRVNSGLRCARRAGQRPQRHRLHRAARLPRRRHARPAGRDRSAGILIAAVRGRHRRLGGLHPRRPL